MFPDRILPLLPEPGRRCLTGFVYRACRRKGLFLFESRENHKYCINMPGQAGNKGRNRRIILEKCRTEFYNM
jgi:hypothetical protein